MQFFDLLEQKLHTVYGFRNVIVAAVPLPVCSGFLNFVKPFLSGLVHTALINAAQKGFRTLSYLVTSLFLRSLL